MYDRKTSDWRGLSPLARGTPILEFVIWTPMRFIPAGAGNSSSAFLCAVSKSVYPRWRGELSTIYPPLLNGTGLSPLARGTLPLVSCRPRKNRFIPAGAGNSNSYTDKSSKQTVYPRWRGKLPLRLMNDNKNGGLSPLARGTRSTITSKSAESRFIPAGAGNSVLSLPYIARISVYPRWRGELISLLEYMSCAHGLSPLARGTPRHAGRAAIPPRFIPAGAGNSFSSSSIAVVLTVYPRWRGELLIRSSYSAPLAGLSPLARGTRERGEIPAGRARFIPAGAGNSLAAPPFSPGAAVYPRWRGELSII